MNDYLSGGRLWRLCQKELRESLRDRRTIITLVMMPILVYPLLSMALQRLMLGTLGANRAEAVFTIGVGDERAASIVNSAINDAQQASISGADSPIKIYRSNSTFTSKFTIHQPTTHSASDPNQEPGPDKPQREESKDQAAFSLVIVTGMSLSTALENGEIDVAIQSAGIEQSQTRRGPMSSYNLSILFRDGDSRSEDAMLQIRRAMQLLNDHQSAMIRTALDPNYRPAVELSASGVGTKPNVAASLAGVIPLVLILMTITGAVYPAIDLTAGERERGTMEAMIATPAPRFALLLSKYVAMVTVAVLTALANLLASWITLSVGGLGRAIFGEQGFSIFSLLQILPLVVIFAAFFSAVLLALCSFARSFKEAQAYLIPVMLLSLGPGLIVLMPNVQFTTLMGIVPLVNILMLSRDIMTGQSTLIPAFVAVFSTLIYAVATLVIASKLFGGEAATAGSQESWADLIRRPKRVQLRPETGELAIYMAFFFPIFFVTTNLLGQLSMSRASILVVNAIALFALFIGLPLLYALFRRLDLVETFRLRWSGNRNSTPFPRLGTMASYLVAVVLMSAGLWMFAYECFIFFDQWQIIPVSLEKSEGLENIKRELLSIPLWLILITGAIAPGLAEEFFFRGFVLSAFQTKLSGRRSVIASAILFGVFHIVSGSVLSLERFLPSTILGLAIGTVAWRTGSLWPGMILHAVHNALVFSAGRFTEEQLTTFLGIEPGSTSRHLPLFWIATGTTAVLSGLIVLFLSTRKPTSHENVH